MTVLSEENEAGETSRGPPRKKLCLSLSKSDSPQRQVSNRNSSSENKGITGHTDNNTDQVKVSKSGTQNNKTEMLNGYLPGDSHKSSTDDSPGSDGNHSSPVATLCNLGNTCFLNSILYTLRFAPSFLHNLHHLVADLKDLSSKNQQIKIKSSSLGRNIGASHKSWSSKDLMALGATNDVQSKSKMQIATERLHELYESLHASELRENSDPFQPDVFLHALRDVNPIFEGNQQHDAHELLVCLLDYIRETCCYLANQNVQKTGESLTNGYIGGDIAPVTQPQPSTSNASSSSKPSISMRKSWKIKRGPRSKSNPNASNLNGLLNGVAESTPLVNGCSSTHALSGIAENPALSSVQNDIYKDQNEVESPERSHKRRPLCHNFISEDFEGVTVLRTTCLECEQVTERKETFCDICVPINSEQRTEDGQPRNMSVSEMYQSAIVTNEFLRDGNKYWCEQCLRLNEARRSVCYQTLPRLLILQLKRFSSTFGSMVCMSKVHDHMSTPLNLNCFCDQCCNTPPEEKRQHSYSLYGVVMHLGATIASGHYVAYVKASENTSDYYHCERDKRKASSLSSSSGKSSSSGGSARGGEKINSIFKFFRAKPSNNNCMENVAKLSASSSAGSYYRQTCRSVDCCGVRVNRSLALDYRPDLQDTTVPEPVWLECDDESVRVLSKKEFEAVLESKPLKNSALTPYLLFYARQQ